MPGPTSPGGERPKEHLGIESRRIDQHHLDTLAAVVEEGTFDAGARRLQLTPSAVSQRIRSLEERVGHVVVRRVKPCTPTRAGELLLRLSRQVRLLEEDTLAALSSPGSAAAWTTLPLGVNADSLATWFHDVIAEVAQWDRTSLQLHVEDQDHSASLLRSGTVLAAVTSEATPVQGCMVRRLGRMRYLPVAAPALLSRWSRPDGSADLTSMPFLQFNEHDDLQLSVLRRMGVDPLPPRSVVPTSQDFGTAIRAGLAWGAIPEPQLSDSLRTGQLVAVTPFHLDVDLSWQQWRLSSPTLDRVAKSVVAAAARHLRPQT